MGAEAKAGRVIGVRAASADGDRTFTAGLVVGADGRYSSVARLVKAEEYFGYDAGRAGFWAYWDAPSCWKSDPAYRFDMYFSHFGGETGIIFPTGKEAGARGPLPELHRIFFSRVDAYPTLKARLFDVIERRRSPFEMVPGWRVLWWALVAAVRGQPRVIRELLAAGQRAVPMYFEWRAMRKLLDEAEASVARERGAA